MQNLRLWTGSLPNDQAHRPGREQPMTLPSTELFELPAPAPVRCSARLGHVVVLFVDKHSIYKSLGVDCYDKQRNAFTYDGNLPVVAHPPCQLWSKMAIINFMRWGGEHNKPGNDGGCFRFAFETVNRCGGVLEHPAETLAWTEHNLPAPGHFWTRWNQGWVCEVWQSAYGHRANKATWLYCSGTEAPLSPRWGRPTGSHQIGFHDQRGKERNKPTLSKREANATPIAFAHYLLELAATCAKWPNDKVKDPAR